MFVWLFLTSDSLAAWLGWLAGCIDIITSLGLHIGSGLVAVVCCGWSFWGLAGISMRAGGFHSGLRDTVRVLS